jgi:hypothetical protein
VIATDPNYHKGIGNRVFLTETPGHYSATSPPRRILIAARGVPLPTNLQLLGGELFPFILFDDRQPLPFSICFLSLLL